MMMMMPRSCPRMDPVEAVQSNAVCEIAKSLFLLILLTLCHLQICCTRRRVRKTKYHVSACTSRKAQGPQTKQVPQNSPTSSTTTRTATNGTNNKRRTKTKPKRTSSTAKSHSTNHREKTIREKFSEAVGGLFKKKNEDVTQVELDSDEEDKPDVVKLEKVKWLGNLDNMMKDKRMQMEKEIEEMKSTHEMEKNEQLQLTADPRQHVRIVEKKCKLYETNDEPTLDDDADDNML